MQPEERHQIVVIRNGIGAAIAQHRAILDEIAEAAPWRFDRESRRHEGLARRKFSAHEVQRYQGAVRWIAAEIAVKIVVLREQLIAVHGQSISMKKSEQKYALAAVEDLGDALDGTGKVTGLVGIAMAEPEPLEDPGLEDLKQDIRVIHVAWERLVVMTNKHHRRTTEERKELAEALLDTKMPFGDALVLLDAEPRDERTRLFAVFQKLDRKHALTHHEREREHAEGATRRVRPKRGEDAMDRGVELFGDMDERTSAVPNPERIWPRFVTEG